jgi:cyanophycin synthetase
VTSLVELRILEGPNLYFPRAAVKLTLDVSSIAEAGDETVLRLARRIGLRTTPRGSAGPHPAGRVSA